MLTCMEKHTPDPPGQFTDTRTAYFYHFVSLNQDLPRATLCAKIYTKAAKYHLQHF